MLFTKLTLCSQIRNIVLKVAMNLVFIYLGEECPVIIYSASELAMGKSDVCFEPDENLCRAKWFAMSLKDTTNSSNVQSSGLVIFFYITASSQEVCCIYYTDKCQNLKEKCLVLLSCNIILGNISGQFPRVSRTAL